MINQFISREQKVNPESELYRSISLEVKRYCPLIQEDVFDIYHDKKEFFKGYRVVALINKTNNQQIFGFYASGDFQPLDFEGQTIKKLNRIHGLLNENIWNYCELQLVKLRPAKIDHYAWLHYPVIISEENKNDFQNSDKIIEAFERKKSHQKHDNIIQYVLIHKPNSKNNTELFRVEFEKINNQFEMKTDRVESINSFNETFWNKLPIIFSTLRVSNALPIQKWNYRMSDLQKNKINSILNEDFLTPIPLIDIKETVYRSAELPFYKDYLLLESIYILKEDLDNKLNYKKTYALIKLKDSAINSIIPLNGKSNIIHQINSEPKQLNLTENNINFYLKFFGWAVHGTEGRFLLPKNLRELELLPGSDNNTYSQLINQELKLEEWKHEDFEILEEKRDSNAFYRKGKLFYSNVVFRVWFKCYFKNKPGNVEMVDDKPIFENLKYKDELYNEATLFQLEQNKLGSSHLLSYFTEANKKIPHWSRNTLKYYYESFLNNEPENITKLTKAIEQKIDSRDSLYSKNIFQSTIIFDNDLKDEKTNLFTQRILIFYKCTFKKSVIFRTLSNLQEIQFIDCSFLDGIRGRNSNLSCSLLFIGCDISPHSTESRKNKNSISLAGSSISRDLILFDCKIAGELYLPFIKLGGSLTIKGCQISRLLDKNVTYHRINIDVFNEVLANIDNVYDFNEISNNLFTRLNWELEGVIVKRPIVNLENSQINNNLEITFSKAEELLFSSQSSISNQSSTDNKILTIIDGEFFAPSITVSGSIYIQGAFFTKKVDLSNSHILKNFTIEQDSNKGFDYFLFYSRYLFNLENCQIEKNLKIRSSILKHGLNATNSKVFGRVEFENSSIDDDICCDGILVSSSLFLKNLSIKGNLSFTGCHITGSVDITFCDIKGDLGFYAGNINTNFNFFGINVTNFNFYFINIKGFLSHFLTKWADNLLASNKTSKSTIKGDFYLSGAKVNFIELRAIIIKGKLDCRFSEFGRFMITWGINFLEPNDKNKEKFEPVLNQIGSIHFYSTIVQEDLILTGIIVNSQIESIDININPNYNEFINGFEISHCKIGGNLLMRRKSNIEYDLKSRYKEIFEAKMDKKFSDSAKSKTDDYSKNDQNLEKRFPTYTKYHRYIGVLVNNSNMNLSANEIGGELELSNSIIEQGKILLNDTHIGLDFNISFIEDNPLIIADVSTDIETFINEPNGYGKTICLHVDLEKIVCQGDIDLSGLYIKCLEHRKPSEIITEKFYSEEKENLKGVIGTLKARDLTVKGELKLIQSDLSSKDHKNLTCNSQKFDEVKSRYLEDFFEVKKAITQKGDYREPDYYRIFNETSIASTLIYKFPFAFIEGSIDPAITSLDLTNSQIGHLIFTNHNIPCKKSRISLARCEIGRLEIEDPCPGPIDLSNIVVNRWVFGKQNSNNNEENKSSENYMKSKENANSQVKNYIEVLSKMRPFDQATWINVENFFRNKALDKEANKIYRAMHYEGDKKNRNKQYTLNILFRGLILLYTFYVTILISLGSIFNFDSLKTISKWITSLGFISLIIILFFYAILFTKQFYGSTISFGTRPWIPMVIVGILFIPTIILFSQPENVRISDGTFEAMQDPSVHPSFKSDDTNDYIYYNYQSNLEDKNLPEIHPKPNWNFIDGGILAAKYQIPIITASGYDRWVASSKVTALGITAEQYSFWISVYHWLAWPIFLIGMTAKVFRGKKE